MASDSAIVSYKHSLPDGRTLGYALCGLGEAFEPKLTLVYHHGWPSCRLEALPLAPWAQNLGWRVIAVDRPGIGESSLDPGGTFESFAADVGSLMDALQADSAVQMGMSGGGPYACACARYLPAARTRALVLLASMCATNDTGNAALTRQMHIINRWQSSLIANEPALQLVLAACRPFLLTMPYVAVVSQAMPRPLSQLIGQLFTFFGFADADRKLLLDDERMLWSWAPSVLQQAVLQGSAGLARDMRITSQPWSFSLGDINVTKALVFQGADDVNVPVAMAEHLAASIPGAKLIVYPGEAHMTLLCKRGADVLLAVADELGLKP